MKKICHVDGCERLAWAKMLCGKHYQRFKSHGDPTHKVNRTIPVKNRLLSKVKINEMSGCWEFNGSNDARGYGMLMVNKKPTRAHRVSYTEFIGQIPDELFVLHKCDNPCCVNPDHLFLGTHRDNMIDRKIKNRSYRAIGSKHPGAKISESDIPLIRKRLMDGESSSAIAKNYSVNRRQIYKIKKGKAWSHVKENSHGI